jgi:hypothetical protein
LAKKIHTAVVVSKPIAAKTSSASSFKLRSIRTCNFTASVIMRGIQAYLRTRAIHWPAPFTQTPAF